ncbi:MAG: ABC transporter ATP-binding protein [Polyangiales bacterium]
MTQPPSLMADDLSIGHEHTHAIASQLRFTVQPGEVLVVLGPNGAGKTTLLRTLLGLQAPLGGRVMVAGRPLHVHTRRERARWLAYVPQARSFEFAFRVLDLVAMGAAPRLRAFQQPTAADYQLAHDALDRLGITHLAQFDEPNLSGGEQQLVLLARALVQQARFLLLDEPTANLDFSNQGRVLAHIAALAKAGLGILMISHSPAHAFACGTHAALFEPDGTLAVGLVDTMLTEERLSRVYGVGVRVLVHGGLRTCVIDPSVAAASATPEPGVS